MEFIEGLSVKDFIRKGNLSEEGIEIKSIFFLKR